MYHQQMMNAQGDAAMAQRGQLADAQMAAGGGNGEMGAEEDAHAQRGGEEQIAQDGKCALPIPPVNYHPPHRSACHRCHTARGVYAELAAVCRLPSDLAPHRLAPHRLVSWSNDAPAVCLLCVYCVDDGPQQLRSN